MIILRSVLDWFQWKRRWLMNWRKEREMNDTVIMIKSWAHFLTFGWCQLSREMCLRRQKQSPKSWFKIILVRQNKRYQVSHCFCVTDLTPLISSHCENASHNNRFPPYLLLLLWSSLTMLLHLHLSNPIRMQWNPCRFIYPI